MSGSGAGLNRVYSTILSCNTGTAVASSPLSSYGTIGVNDSGMVLNEALGFTKWTFTLLGGGTGYSVSVYGTNDPTAHIVWSQKMNPGQYTTPASLPASSWFLLPGPSEQTGTGTIANPMTGTAPVFQFSGSLLAVRAVLTASATPAGSITVAVLAVP